MKVNGNAVIFFAFSVLAIGLIVFSMGLPTGNVIGQVNPTGSQTGTTTGQPTSALTPEATTTPTGGIVLYLPLIFQQFTIPTGTVTPMPTNTGAPTTQPTSGATPTGGATHTITVGPASAPTSFAPAALGIKVGDTVRWVWASNGHTVTSGTNGVADNKFCSPDNTNCATSAASNTGAVYVHTFTQTGTFPYFSRGETGMTGVITVNP